MSAKRWRWWSPKRSAQAKDAAELVAVEYEELPAVVDLREAMKPGAPQLHADAPGNLAIDWPGTVPSEDNEREVAEDHQEAPHVARVTVVNQRMVVASMETRGATGIYDKENESYTLHACSQSAGALRSQARADLRRADGKAARDHRGCRRRLRHEDAGLSGIRLRCWSPRAKLGRPVHWKSTRSEAFITDTQARDTGDRSRTRARREGQIPGAAHAPSVQSGRLCQPGRHRHQHQQFRALPARHVPHSEDRFLVALRISPTPRRSGPIAAPGDRKRTTRSTASSRKPRASSASTRARLRKKNLIPQSSMPYKTAVTTTYDSGDFPGIFAKAIELADYDNFNKRKRESARRKKLRGIGISCMLEHAGALPTESASLQFPGGDKLVMGLNVQSTGQSHATVFGRVLARQARHRSRATIVHRHGDIAMRDLPGFASVGSRSAMCGGRTPSSRPPT